MSDKLSRSGSDAAKEALDTAKETGKGNVRSSDSDAVREARSDSGAREGTSSAGRGVRSGMSNLGGGGGKSMFGGIGLMGVIVLIVIVVGIYLLLRG